MLIFSTLLCLFLAGLNLIGIYRNRKRQKLNEIIAVGLDALIAQTREQLHKNQKLVERAKSAVEESNKLVSDLGDDFLDDRGMPNLQSAPMLSSLITVMIKKYGTTALGLDDFTAVTDSDFVSVYINSHDGNIILSIDPNLGKEDSLSMMNFVDFDDKIYN